MKITIGSDMDWKVRVNRLIEMMNLSSISVYFVKGESLVSRFIFTE
jgi:hypothetical protein